MTTRTHLSIGEVLSLLSDDFPDLTITKIRFLESQGLIDPERTASGYRKFYDYDIERLRWILRQQRENFLPLKVIRDRLDESDGKESTAASRGPAQAELDLARDPGHADPPPVWMADHARVNQGHTAQGDRPDAEPAPTGKATGSADRAGTTGSHAAAATPGAVAPAVSSPPRDAATAEPAKPTKKPKQKPKKKKSEQPMSTSKGAGPTKSAKTAAGKSGGHDVSDVSMSRTELLGAAGLTDAQLSDLESFGIVTATEGPDAELYGADAMVCARHAATMLRLGLEPRHLRAFKVAADREAGLYEQLILPVLRRRTPDARAEAHELVDELTTSAEAIHAALLRISMSASLGTRR